MCRTSRTPTGASRRSGTCSRDAEATPSTIVRRRPFVGQRASGRESSPGLWPSRPASDRVFGSCAGGALICGEDVGPKPKHVVHGLANGKVGNRFVSKELAVEQRRGQGHHFGVDV